MGAGFVILLHLIAVLILSVVTAVIATILTAIISNREKKTKKIVVAFFAPFLFFFGTYFLALA